MDGKQWQPVGDGDEYKTTDMRIGIGVLGNESRLWLCDADDFMSIELPDNIRLCRLVDAPAPAAWGPPLAQPDSDGWWAFAGDTPLRLGECQLFDIYEARKDDEIILRARAARDDDEYSLDELSGRWWRIYMPWEVQP